MRVENDGWELAVHLAELNRRTVVRRNRVLLRETPLLVVARRVVDISRTVDRDPVDEVLASWRSEAHLEEEFTRGPGIGRRVETVTEREERVAGTGATLRPPVGLLGRDAACGCVFLS